MMKACCQGYLQIIKPLNLDLDDGYELRTCGCGIRYLIKYQNDLVCEAKIIEEKFEKIEVPTFRNGIQQKRNFKIFSTRDGISFVEE